MSTEPEKTAIEKLKEYFIKVKELNRQDERVFQSIKNEIDLIQAAMEETWAAARERKYEPTIHMTDYGDVTFSSLKYSTFEDWQKEQKLTANG